MRKNNKTIVVFGGLTKHQSRHDERCNFEYAVNVDDLVCLECPLATCVEWSSRCAWRNGRRGEDGLLPHQRYYKRNKEQPGFKEKNRAYMKEWKAKRERLAALAGGEAKGKMIDIHA